MSGCELNKSTRFQKLKEKSNSMNSSAVFEYDSTPDSHRCDRPTYKTLNPLPASISPESPDLAKFGSADYRDQADAWSATQLRIANIHMYVRVADLYALQYKMPHLQMFSGYFVNIIWKKATI
ncbi:hypothetical protein Trydic_g3118 [Trypoxylus dichotomus]